MLADRTIALAVPFLVTTSQASVVCPRDIIPFLPSLSVSYSEPLYFQQVNVPHDGTVDKQVPFAPLAAGVPPTSSQLACKPKNDWDCYKTYYQEYNYCHPYDTWCYKDCSDWNQYKDHCYHKDYDYPCYDKCHYGNDDCEKWKECHSHDHDCYKKKHDEHFKNCDYRDQHCYKNKEPYYKKPEQTPACKPWDWECHKKFHKDHDFECNPWKDKYCYPYYYPEPTCPEKEVPKEPNEDVNLWLYSPCESPSCFEKNGYALKVWPDGDENWTGRWRFLIPMAFQRGA